MFRKKWFVPILAVSIMTIILIVVAVGAGFSTRTGQAPSAVEECTLYYLNGEAKAEGRPFSLWCPSTGWIEVPPLAESRSP